MTPASQADSIAVFRAAVEGLGECLRFFTQNHRVLNHLPDWIRNPEEGGVDVERLQRAHEAARHELSEFSDHQLHSRPPAEPDHDEHRELEILACCALRFDGYKYVKASSFDFEQATHRALEGHGLPEGPLELLAMFFMLQRFLGKWGGEYEPRDGRYWRLFRELFLLVARLHVPVEFRPDDHTWRLRWRHRCRPRLAETLAVVQRIHQATQYRDV